MYKNNQSPLLRSKLLVIRAVFLLIVLAMVLVATDSVKASTGGIYSDSPSTAALFLH